MTYKVTPRETSDIIRAVRTTQKSSGSKSWSTLPTQLARTNIERVTDGANVPRYFTRKRKGELLPFTHFRQFEAETTSRNYSNSWETATSTSDTVKGSGSNTPQTEYELTEYSYSYGYDNILYDVDAGMFLQDAAAAITSKGMDALTFVAQLHKTRQMFVEIVHTIRRLISGRYSGVNWANAWLEGRYGWRTLRFDLIDLHDACNNFDYTRRRFTERRGTSYSYTLRQQSDATTTAGTYTTYRDETIEVGVRGTVVADFAPSRFRASPMTTAWELVPWSFVVDWLFTVGSMLEAAQFLVQVENYAAGCGVQATATVKFTVGNLRPKLGINSWSFTRDQTERGVWLLRNPARVSLTPTTRLKFDAWKGLDALSLLKQQLAKRR